MIFNGVPHRLLFAEDLQHEAFSGSVTDESGQQQQNTDDDRCRSPQACQKKAPDHKNDSEDYPDDLFTLCDIFYECHDDLPDIKMSQHSKIYGKFL
jgi:hypothetical protein